MREGFVPLPFLYSVTAALDGWWRPDGMRRRRSSPAGHGNPPPDSGALRTRRRLHRIPRSLEGEELRTLGSCFPNFTNRTPGAQAGEARELCPPHPIKGYEIEEIVRSAAAVANAKIRFRTSSRSWTALIRLSRIDGTTPAADWEPGAWKLMGYEVAPSLHDWLRAKLWKVIARETIERKIS